MTEAIRAFNWRLMWALVVRLPLTGAAVAAPASPGRPQFTILPDLRWIN